MANKLGQKGNLCFWRLVFSHTIWLRKADGCVRGRVRWWHSIPTTSSIRLGPMESHLRQHLGFACLIYIAIHDAPAHDWDSDQQARLYSRSGPACQALGKRCQARVLA